MPSISLDPEITSKYNAVADLDSSRGYLNFLSYCVVDAHPRKRPFRSIAEEWQWDRAKRAAGAIDYAAGITDHYDGPLAFWNGYHKGSDKTHDTAREICFLLGWARKRVNIYICAGSEDQAGLITTAMQGIVNDNSWIADKVDVTALTAHGASGSSLTVLSMNAYTSQGVFPDYMVAEEVTHWMYDEGRLFWDFILSSVNKRPGCVLKVNTNAGHIGSWQWDERNRISKSKFWSFYEAPVGKPLPSWMNQAKIDDDSQGMSPGEQARLYTNRWVDPGEEFGYLTMEMCQRCVDTSLQERIRGERYTEYFLVVDYGGVHDRCALTVMHTYPKEVTVLKPDGTIEEQTRIHAVVDRLDCWQGSRQHPIPINIPEKEDGTLDTDARSVESWIDVTLKNFRIEAIVLDPHQLEALAIKYEQRGRRVERFRWRQGQNNHRMAQLLKTCVENRQVTWSPGAGILEGVEDRTLVQELSRLVIKEMAYGYRFDHEAGRHDDRACAVAMGLVFSMPDTHPPGGPGPFVVLDNTTAKPIGGEKSQSVLVDNNPIATWNILGMAGRSETGSAWQRGDISGERP